MKKRIFSTALALIMCLTLLPAEALAAEPEEEDTGLCAHHTEHTAECGYAAPTEGAPCTHEHDESCGYAAAEAEVPWTRTAPTRTATA